MLLSLLTIVKGENIVSVISLTLCISAVLITGGTGKNTAELYIPSLRTSCSLPSLPEERDVHTLDNDILCGGAGTSDNCLQWSPSTGSWEALLTLDIRRYNHVSWTPGSGIGTYLMGGEDASMNTPMNTTTLIKPDGTQEQGFPLKYISS